MRMACELQDLDSLFQVIDSPFQSLDLISEAFDCGCIVICTFGWQQKQLESVEQNCQ